MTPEQEDAHWALQGLPLMRHWIAYRRITRAGTTNKERSDALVEFVKVLHAHGISNDAYSWTWQGIQIDGVFYPNNVEGL